MPPLDTPDQREETDGWTERGRDGGLACSVQACRNGFYKHDQLDDVSPVVAP